VGRDRSTYRQRQRPVRGERDNDLPEIKVLESFPGAISNWPFEVANCADRPQHETFGLCAAALKRLR
jgi:hypothetical protein